MKLSVFKRIKYYFRVWLATFKMSLSKAAEFKLEVLVRFLRGVMLVAIQIVFIKAVIGNSDNIAGWSEQQIYLLSGIFNMINYIAWAFFAINQWRIEEKILKDEFDSLLLKPLSSIYAASFPDFFIDEAITAIAGVFLVAYYVFMNFATLSYLNLFYGLITTICGVLIWFALELIFASFDFLAIKNGLREIKKNLSNVGRFPIEIWNPMTQIIFFTLFPIAFVSAVPAGLISGIFDWKFVIYSILISVLFFQIARKFWYFAIKRYSGTGG